jgi:hypothetical protein
MVTDKIKKKVMEGAMKFIASEQGQKLMQNPQLMQALMKAMELRGKLQEGLDLKSIQKALNLVTKEELDGLSRTLDELRGRLDGLRKQTEEIAAVLQKLQGK